MRDVPSQQMGPAAEEAVSIPDRHIEDPAKDAVECRDCRTIPDEDGRCACYDAEEPYSERETNP